MHLYKFGIMLLSRINTSFSFCPQEVRGNNSHGCGGKTWKKGRSRNVGPGFLSLCGSRLECVSETCLVRVEGRESTILRVQSSFQVQRWSSLRELVEMSRLPRLHSGFIRGKHEEATEEGGAGSIYIFSEVLE